MKNIHMQTNVTWLKLGEMDFLSFFLQNMAAFIPCFKHRIMNGGEDLYIYDNPHNPSVTEIVKENIILYYLYNYYI